MIVGFLTENVMKIITKEFEICASNFLTSFKNAKSLIITNKQMHETSSKLKKKRSFVVFSHSQSHYVSFTQEFFVAILVLEALSGKKLEQDQ